MAETAHLEWRFLMLIGAIAQLQTKLVSISTRFLNSKDHPLLEMKDCGIHQGGWTKSSKDSEYQSRLLLTLPLIQLKVDSFGTSTKQKFNTTSNGCDTPGGLDDPSRKQYMQLFGDLCHGVWSLPTHDLIIHISRSRAFGPFLPAELHEKSLLFTHDTFFVPHHLKTSKQYHTGISQLPPTWQRFSCQATQLRHQHFMRSTRPCQHSRMQNRNSQARFESSFAAPLVSYSANMVTY